MAIISLFTTKEDMDNAALAFSQEKKKEAERHAAIRKDWKNWDKSPAYRCPLCKKYFVKPWSHLCKMDRSLIQCGECKHHYIGDITSGGYDYESPEVVGSCHSCRIGHNNNTPRMRECKDYDPTPVDIMDFDTPPEELEAKYNETRWKL